MVTFTYNMFFNFSTQLLDTLYSLSYIYYYDFLYVMSFLIVFWNILLNKTFRAKFIYFFLVLLLIASWGFYYSFDGIIMLFIIAELLIILLFLLLYLTITFELTQTIKNAKVFWLYSFLGLLVYFNPVYYKTFINLLTYVNVYQQFFDVISADFFIFFYFFFLTFPHITILVAILLGLFSIFFIFFYFTLKFSQQITKTKQLNYLFIRKQQLLHQANYNTNLTTFQ